MPVALVAMSHTPVMGVVDPGPGIEKEVREQIAMTRRFVENFEPDVAIVFGPDHFHGFLYSLMPAYCVGRAATAQGDYGLPTGPIPVDRVLADAVIDASMAQSIDIAVTEDYRADHGIVQPLDLLFGGVENLPIVPIFLNSVAHPLVPPQRIRQFGSAVGSVIADSDQRVLIIGSGGLSHSPPVPAFADAAADVRQRLTHGLDEEARAAHEARVYAAARAFADGDLDLIPLNPAWDQLVMETLHRGDFDAVDRWTTDWCQDNGGTSAHEIRTWIAAFAALAQAGPFQIEQSYYRAIDAWIAGFGITTARPQTI